MFFSSINRGPDHLLYIIQYYGTKKRILWAKTDFLDLTFEQWRDLHIWNILDKEKFFFILLYCWLLRPNDQPLLMYTLYSCNLYTTKKNLCKKSPYISGFLALQSFVITNVFLTYNAGKLEAEKFKAKIYSTIADGVFFLNWIFSK